VTQVDAPPATAVDHDSRHAESLSGRVRRGALWSAANTLVLKFANIAIMAVVARTLTPRDFGIFAVAMTVHTIVSGIAEFGVSSSLMRGDIDPDEIAPTVATISLVSSTILAATMVAFARPISGALGSVDAAGPMRVMALAVLLVGVFAVPAADLSREFRQNQQFQATLVGFVPANALLIIMAITGSGAMSFAWSRVVGQLITGAVITRLAPRRYMLGFSRRHVRFLIGFGLPIAGANLLNYVLLNADYALVGRLLGAVELGTYMLAFNIASWSTSLLSAMVNGVALPAFSRIKHDRERLQRALGSATRAVALIALPICGLTFSLSHPLVATVYGRKWDAAATVLTILSVYGAISVLCLLLANVLTGMGHTKALFVVQVAWLLALVPLMAIGVKVHGIIGAGWAHIIVVCLVALPAYFTMLKRATAVRLRPLLRAIAPALAGGIACALASFLSARAVSDDLAKLLLGGIAGLAAYLSITMPALLPYVRSAIPLPARLVALGDQYCVWLSNGPGRSRARYPAKHRRYS
jgi:PST family polysaccharide transporter